MKKMYSFLTLWSFLLLTSQSTFSQLSIKKAPPSLTPSVQGLMKASNALSLTPVLDLKAPEKDMIQKAIKNDSIGTFTVGITIPVNENTSTVGTWTKLSDGSRVWRLSIKSQGASALSLMYDRFYLPKGSRFYILDSTGQKYLGAFTDLNNKGSRSNPKPFATALMDGSAITLEYYAPVGVTGDPIISIKKVVYNFRHINFTNSPYNGDYGSADACSININCPPLYSGTVIQNVKRAIAFAVYPSEDNTFSILGSGALINDAAQDGIPYFLTANHCLGGNSYDAVSKPNAPYWTCYWNYESSDCNNSTYVPLSSIPSTVGATVVANNQPSDFALLRLTEDPAELSCYFPYYLGFYINDLNVVGTHDFFGIHHPVGDIKKISYFSSAVINSSSIGWNDNTTSPAYSHLTAHESAGEIKGGSSGSPLMTASGLIIGQLHGGSDSCAPANFYFGRIQYSWNLSSTFQRQLKHWLDPNTTITSNNPFLSGMDGSPIILGANQICLSEVYHLSKKAIGSYITWSASNSNVTLTPSATGDSVTVYKTGGSSSVILTATINQSCGSLSVTRTISLPSYSGPGHLTLDKPSQSCMTYGSRPYITALDDNGQSLCNNANITEVEWQVTDYSNNSPITNYLTSSCGNVINSSIGILFHSNPSPYVVEVVMRGKDACGNWGNWGPGYGYYIKPTCSSFVFSISPNPASSSLKIESLIKKSILKSAAKLSNLNKYMSIKKVSVFDKMGQLKLSKNYSENSGNVQLDVSSLKPDVYYIEIRTKDFIEHQSIVVK